MSASYCSTLQSSQHDVLRHPFGGCVDAVTEGVMAWRLVGRLRNPAGSMRERRMRIPPSPPVLMVRAIPRLERIRDSISRSGSQSRSVRRVPERGRPSARRTRLRIGRRAAFSMILSARASAFRSGLDGQLSSVSERLLRAICAH